MLDQETDLAQENEDLKNELEPHSLNSLNSLREAPLVARGESYLEC